MQIYVWDELYFLKKELNGPTWLGTKDSLFERRCLIGQVLSMTDVEYVVAF
jgi:hypothetical protein